MQRPELSAFDQAPVLPAADDRVVELPASPLHPGLSPVRLRVRIFGAGVPLVILHGGWGAGVYPFDRQIAALAGERRIIVPDRSGYGGSGRLNRQATDFHRRAAAETFALIDALAVDEPVLWGHSDGAIIALMMALDAPDRLAGVVAEATHFFRRKPASRAFFETMRDRPGDLGERTAAALAGEHGERWQRILSINGDAWLRLAEQGGDLYEGRLAALRVPALFIHGARDPRTEPGELDALRAALMGGKSRDLPDDRHVPPDARSPLAAQDFGPAFQFAICPDAGHSPHSEPASAGEVTRVAAQFLASVAPAAARSSPRR